MTSLAVLVALAGVGTAALADAGDTLPAADRPDAGAGPTRPVRGAVRRPGPVDARLTESGSPAPPAAVRAVAVRPQADDERVERAMASLDLRGRVGQLLLAYPQINRTGPVEVGGLLFVGNSLKNLEKARARIQGARVRARIPPFVAVDMEGGSFNRMKRHPALRDLPGASELARLPDDEVEAWGFRVGVAMRENGLNMNLAPVLDVAARGHMARNGRAFSGSVDVVVSKAGAYAAGLLRAGVVPVGKHFPGYGDLEDDSDHQLVVSGAPPDSIARSVDAFRRVAHLLGGVMMANVGYAAYGRRPAILDPELVELAHRDDWLAVTDDISIRLLADSIGGSSEDVLRQALLAGNDVLLTTAPPDWDQGIDYFGVLSSLAESDSKARERVDTACRRVLRLKDRMGLLDALSLEGQPAQDERR